MPQPADPFAVPLPVLPLIEPLVLLPELVVVVDLPVDVDPVPLLLEAPPLPAVSSQPAVTKWKIGITRPSEERRAILETRYKIPHWSWNQQPSQPQGRHIGVVPEQE